MRRTIVLTLILMGLAAVGLVFRGIGELPSLANRTSSSAFDDTADTRLGRVIAPMAAVHPGLSGIHPLVAARDAFAARVLLARAAERSIDAQYYIWHRDLTGTLLFDELRAAADRGVRVRLLQDDNTTPGMDEALSILDAHPNIEVRLFNPFVIRTPRLVGYLTDFSRLNRRMHNKSFTVDNQVTIVGGRNVGDEYFGAGDGALYADLDVLAVGPVVREVSNDFDRYWASASAYPAEHLLPRVSADREQRLAAESARSGRPLATHQYIEAVRKRSIVAQLTEGRLPLDWVPVRMVSDDPAKGLGGAASGDLFVSRLDELLERPVERLELVSSYFVPEESGVGALAGMTQRGVRVTILTNSLEATDVPIVHSGYAKYRRRLLASGVRLWEARGSPGGRARSKLAGTGSAGSGAQGSATALHAKTFAVDGARVFVGSFNFDPRSARLNTEMGVVIDSPALARRIEAAFDESIPALSYEVRLGDDGELYWIERRDARVIRHDVEPGTTMWQRAFIRIVGWLPIEGLL